MEQVIEKCQYQHFEQLPGNFFLICSPCREILSRTIYMTNFRSIGSPKQKLQRGQNLSNDFNINLCSIKRSYFWFPRLSGVTMTTSLSGGTQDFLMPIIPYVSL